MDVLFVELLEQALPSMLGEARLPTLARWLEHAAAHHVQAPVIDLTEAELAFRDGDRIRAEALAKEAARRLGDEHPMTSRALSLAGASAHLTCRDEIALEYYRRARASARDSISHRRAVWGEFLATVSLEED